MKFHIYSKIAFNVRVHSASFCFILRTRSIARARCVGYDTTFVYNWIPPEVSRKVDYVNLAYDACGIFSIKFGMCGSLMCFISRWHCHRTRMRGQSAWHVLRRWRVVLWRLSKSRPKTDLEETGACHRDPEHASSRMDFGLRCCAAVHEARFHRGGAYEQETKE